jgi:hypothetical protein
VEQSQFSFLVFPEMIENPLRQERKNRPSDNRSYCDNVIHVRRLFRCELNSNRRATRRLRLTTLPSFGIFRIRSDATSVERVPRATFAFVLVDVLSDKVARDDVIFRSLVSFEGDEYVDMGGGFDFVRVLPD